MQNVFSMAFGDFDALEEENLFSFGKSPNDPPPLFFKPLLQFFLVKLR